MESGVYRIPVAGLLERELIAQTGKSLPEWANDRGIPFDFVLRALQGENDEIVLDELASTFGISPSAVREWIAASA